LKLQKLLLDKDQLNELSKVVVDSAFAVHTEMGPGLLEAVYQQCLIHELNMRSVRVDEMVIVPLLYKGAVLKKDYVLDILVEEEIILELKAVEGILPVHEAQIISYLKLARKKLGFLINFNVPLLKHGLRRFVNNF
jgi:GxxExxY protein